MTCSRTHNWSGKFRNSQVFQLFLARVQEIIFSGLIIFCISCNLPHNPLAAKNDCILSVVIWTIYYPRDHPLRNPAVTSKHWRPEDKSKDHDFWSSCCPDFLTINPFYYSPHRRWEIIFVMALHYDLPVDIDDFRVYRVYRRKVQSQYLVNLRRPIAATALHAVQEKRLSHSRWLSF